MFVGTNTGRPKKQIEKNCFFYILKSLFLKYLTTTCVDIDIACHEWNKKNVCNIFDYFYF